MLVWLLGNYHIKKVAVTTAITSVLNYFIFGINITFYFDLGSGGVMSTLLLNFIGLCLIIAPHAFTVDGKVKLYFQKNEDFWNLSILQFLHHQQQQRQHIAFFFSDFKYHFDPKYMNLSTDLSIYKTNTKKHPVNKVPEVKIEIFEDIPRLHVSNSYATKHMEVQCRQLLWF